MSIFALPMSTTTISIKAQPIQQLTKHYTNQQNQLIIDLSLYQHESNTIQDNDDNINFIAELEAIIGLQVNRMEEKQLKNNYIMASLTDDLEDQLIALRDRLKQSNLEQNLNTHMHIQAIQKILVFVHGKSQFRLVSSHFHLGQSYLKNQCYQQSIDHLTIALKKNAKISEIKQTKIYHSYLLTCLSECYYELECYEDSLQILNRAYQIQQCYINCDIRINNINTIKMISMCWLKLKNFRMAIDYIDKILPLVEKLKGINSQDYLQTKFQKSIISAEQGNLQSAIEQIKNAIELLQHNTILPQLLKIKLTLKYYKKLAQFQQKFCDYSNQIECYRQMQILFKKHKQNENFFNILNLKKKVIIIAINQSNYTLALKQLQQILYYQIQKYDYKSIQVCKTMKMLGLVHLHVGNQKHSQQYFKKCNKTIHQIQEDQKQNQKSEQKSQSSLNASQKHTSYNHILNNNTTNKDNFYSTSKNKFNSTSNNNTFKNSSNNNTLKNSSNYNKFKNSSTSNTFIIPSNQSRRTSSFAKRLNNND